MVSYKALNTIIEATLSQTGYGVGNRDAGQARAEEATLSQTGYGVRNRDAGQARAFWEAPASQTGYGVRNHDAGQARAFWEALISQTGYGVGRPIHPNRLRDNDRAFVFGTTISHTGRFIFRVQVVVNAIHFYLVRPSGEDSQEEEKE